MNFNCKYIISKGHSMAELEQFQIKNNVTLPSDLIHLMMNFNEFNLANDQLGIIYHGAEEIASLDSPLLNLNDFYSWNFDETESAKEFYEFNRSEYFKIGSLSFNGVLLIGKTLKNTNEIFIEVPFHTEGVLKVADNYFQFINEEIEIVP